MRAGSAAKLIVYALLQRLLPQRFLPLARRHIETVEAQDGQYLRPSDPAYEQVLDSLAMVARHTPVPLLEALLRWRESESLKGANERQHSRERYLCRSDSICSIFSLRMFMTNYHVLNGVAPNCLSDFAAEFPVGCTSYMSRDEVWMVFQGREAVKDGS